MFKQSDIVQSFIKTVNLSEEKASQLVTLLESFERSTLPESGPSPDGRKTLDLEMEAPGTTFGDFGPEPSEPISANVEPQVRGIDDKATLILPDPEERGSRPGVSLGEEGLQTEESDFQKLGRYTDLGVLGIGGMGEVRRVRDEDLKRTLAMKIIHPRLMGSNRAVSRFVEEAQIEAQLQHPNIIPIHEIGRLPDGRHYFTMKQVQGTEFFQHITAVHEASSPQQWRPAPDGSTLRDLVQTFHKICVTIAYTHSQGVIHRDLKPDNIMIGGFGEVLVVDWGLAKVMGRSDETNEADEAEQALETDRSSGDILATRMGSVYGTPCYMSPEQARGLTDQVGFTSDIYTLGSILYEILSGSPPYLGSTADEVIEKVKSSAPPSLGPSVSQMSGEPPARLPSLDDFEPLEGSASKIPHRLVQICERAMQREISDRYASAEDLAGEVRDWLEGAEKRDKGLKEVQNAQQSQQQASEQRLQAAQLWREANALLEREGLESSRGWERWSESRAAESMARRIQRRHGQQLQGALVHAPELEEAHQPLAELRMAELVEASAVGNRPASESLRQQFQTHLQFLAQPAQTALEEQLQRQLTDSIFGQRSRRGILIGREVLRESIAAQIQSGSRLLTLVGTAGVGKTRLALELSDDLCTEAGRAYFCDLTEATDELGVLRIIARTMDIRLQDSGPMAHLTELLRAQPTLLILDNLEQVVDAVGPTCQAWFEQLPELQIIATSRVRLNVPAEKAMLLKPLTLLEGVELFTRCGQAADSRFELQADNRTLVCELVRKLDGLPLAIELAAARLDILSLKQVSEHLAERFSLLRSRGRGAQALQGALDWSWDLLEPWAQAALSQASIFRGGFNLAAAESTLEIGKHTASPAVFDILGELTDNSLLRKDQTSDGSVRYGLLESIRAYASEKLHTSGAVEPGLSGPEAAQAVQHRHAAYFAHMGSSQFLATLDRFDNSGRWITLFSELDNLVAAVNHASPQFAPKCCIAALKILGMKGPVSLGVDIATQVLGIPGISRRLQMQIEIERSKCLRISGRMSEARAVVRNSVVPFLPDEDPEVEEATESGDLHPKTSLGTLTEGNRLVELGAIEHQASHFNEAVSHYSTALQLFRAQSDQTGEACVLKSLAMVHHDQGATDLAVETYQQVLVLHRELGSRPNEAATLGSLGFVLESQGKVDEAIHHYQLALPIVTMAGDMPSRAAFLGRLGGAFHRAERFDEAREALREAIVLADTCAPIAAGAFRGTLALLLAEHEQLDEVPELLETGEALVELQPEEHGKFLCKKGRVQLLAGQLETASQTLAQAQSIDDTLGLPEHSALGRSTAELKASLAAHGHDGPVPFEEPKPEAGDPAELAILEGDRLRELGNIELEQANYEAAKACYDRALDIYRTHDHRLGEGTTLGNLGSVFRYQGKLAESIENYMGAIEITREAGDKSREGTFLANLAGTLQSMGRFEDAVTYSQSAIEVLQEVGNQRIEGIVIGNLGGIYQVTGKHELAIEQYQRALQIHRSVGDRRSEGTFLGNLGTAYLGLQRFNEAIGCLREAIEIHQDAGDNQNHAIFLSNLGKALDQIGQSEDGQASLEEAIRLSAGTDSVITGTCQGSLALLHARQGRFTEATIMIERGEPQVRAHPIEHGKLLCQKGQVLLLQGRSGAARDCLAQALAIADDLKIYPLSELLRDIQKLTAMLEPADVMSDGHPAPFETTEGDQVIAQISPMNEAHLPSDGFTVSDGGSARGDGPAMWLLQAARHLEIGSVEQELSNFEIALEQYHQAIEIYRAHDHAIGVATTLNHIGKAHRQVGRIDEAMTCFQQSLQLALEQGDSESRVQSLNHMGNAYHNLGRPHEARKCYLQTLEVLEARGDRRQIGISHGGIGNCFLLEGKLDEATDHYELAIEIAREVGDIRNEVLWVGSLGSVSRDRGIFDKAIHHYRHAIHLHQEMGNRRNEGIFLGNLGLVYSAQGNLKQAIEHYQRTIRISQETGDLRGEGIFLGNMGDTLVKLDRYEEATAALERAIELCVESYPAGAGAFRGSLALILAQRGELMGARRLLDEGEPLLESQPEELGKFLCKKGQVLLLGGQADDARVALASAKSIAIELKITEHSELAQAVAHLEAQSEASDVEDPSLLEARRLVQLANIEFHRSRFAEASKHYHSALKIYRANENKTGTALVLANLGNICLDRGRLKEAQEHYERAVLVYKETGDSRREAISLANLGEAHRCQGNIQEGIEFLQRAIEIFRTIGDRFSEGINIGNIGLAYSDLGELPEAERHYARALEIHREVGNRAGEGAALGSLGTVSQSHGRLDEALAHHQAALEIHREIHSQRSEGATLGNIGDVLYTLGRKDEARQTLSIAIEICDQSCPPGAGSFRGSLALLQAERGDFEDAHQLLKDGEPYLEAYPEELGKFLCKRGRVSLLGNDPAAARRAQDQASALAKRLGLSPISDLSRALAALSESIDAHEPAQELETLEANRLRELGNIDYQQALFEPAIENYKAALEIYRRLKNKTSEGIILGNLANVYRSQGRLEEAIAHYQLSIQIDTEVGNLHGLAMHRGNLGTVYRDQGQLEEAIFHYEQAIEITQDIGDQLSLAVNLGNLGGIHQGQGSLDKASDYYKRTITIFQEFGNRRGEGLVLGNLGGVYQAQGRIDEAIEHLQQAIGIHQEVGDKRSEGIFLGNLGSALLQIGRPDEAQKSLRKAIALGDENFQVSAGACRGTLAFSIARAGQIDDALQLLQIGQEQVQDYPQEYSKFLCQKGQVQQLAGQHKAALQSLHQAKGIATNLTLGQASEAAQAIASLTAVLAPKGPEPGEGSQLELLEAKRLIELGRIEFDHSHFDQAEVCFQSALAIFQTRGDRSAEGRALDDLGAVFFAHGQYLRAEETIERAILIHRELGNNNELGSCFGNLGNVRRARGDHEGAIEVYSQAIVLLREAGDQRGMGTYLGNLGNVYISLGQYEDAASHYKQAIDINRIVGDKRCEGIFLGNLGDALFALGRFDEAGSTLQDAIGQCDHTFPVAAGAFRGTLALLHAQTDQVDEAMSLLEIGEPQVEPMPEEYAKFLCKKGRVQCLGGQAQPARESLQKARKLALEMTVTEQSELGQSLLALGLLLEVRGE